MALEAWVLDGVTLTSGSFRMMELTADPPAEKAQWVSSADSEWAALLDVPNYENREITMKLRVVPQASMDLALNQIAVIRDKLRLAARSNDGIQLVWTPNDSTRSVIFYVLNGMVTELPIGSDGLPAQWFKAQPVFTIKLVCKPGWVSATETVTSATTAATPVVSMDVTVGGDLPALGRLIVTDAAAQPRRDVEWGIENRSYVVGTSLVLDSDSLTANSGTQTTRSGSYDPNATGNNVIRASTVAPSPLAICSAVSQTHIGTFRVWARVFVARSSQRVRLAWRVGDNRYTLNSWVAPPISTAGWCEMDLGTVVIPTVLAGTQSWDARVDAYESDLTVTPAAVDVDFLRLTAAGEGYGRARAVFTYNPGVTSGYDQFAGATGNLGGRVAPLGGTWASTLAGVGTTDLVGSNNQFVTSQGGADNRRHGILGTTSFTNAEVSADVFLGSTVPASAGASGVAWVTQGVIARWVDVNNFASAVILRSSGFATSPPSVALQINAGSTNLANAALPTSTPLQCRVRLIVYTSGFVIAQVLDLSGVLLATASATASTLATGGTLAAGRSGIIDTNFQYTSPPLRAYDNFTAAVPDSFPPVVYSGQSIQFRHDAALRTSSGGTLYGGTSRVGVAARRGDLAVDPADAVTDSTTIQVAYRTRGLVIPRT
jgi:hypothetical protein